MNLNKHIRRVKSILESDSHFFAKGDAVSTYQQYLELSEREAAKLLDISKTAIHRLIKTASASKEIREAAIKHKTHYHAVYYLLTAPREEYAVLERGILSGTIKTHKQIKIFLDARKDPKKKKIQDEIIRLEQRLTILKSGPGASAWAQQAQ